MTLRTCLSLIGCLVLVCCAAPAEDETDDSSGAVIASQQDGAPTEFPEVVQVLVNNSAQDYCSGVLVSPTRVLTAAHCMAGATFVVRAPNAPKVNGRAPESQARKAGSVTTSSDYNEEITKEDIATLDLSTPITIGAYPTLEDVGELGARTLKAIAVGRNAESRNAPLVKSRPLTVKSGTPMGYTTGLVTQYYSSGGDSGGPLFRLDAQGRATHVVIGLERQPDPPNEFFTRITPAVKRLIASNASNARPSGQSPAPAPTSTGR
jgi:V8-like Glu-specific endopeptidase